MQPDVRRDVAHDTSGPQFRHARAVRHSSLVHIQLPTVSCILTGGNHETQARTCWTCCARWRSAHRWNGIGHAARPSRTIPDFKLQTLRALLWFAARMVVSAQHPFTDGTAKASAAMVMACIEATHTI